MELWSENQRQSHVYSRLGPVTGRNCAHNYHNRHQMSHYPLTFGAERESSEWTHPASRAALPQYINWTEPTSSFHFPGILDTQHHQRGYPQPEAGVREWTASQRAVRDCDRGPLREGWQQRRWEPSNPLSYNREVSARRNDSNYRELEAWAARYSLSLPRRRRVEADQGTSQGLLGPQMQHVQINPNNRISELWDRRLQAPTHNTNFTEENSYQRMAFSQPPGYVAPPSYKNPQKSSPVKPFCDTSIKQHGHPKMEKEKFRTPDESETRSGLEGMKHTSQDGDALQSDSAIKTQEAYIQTEGVLPLQHPQKVQNSKITPKVIEGRKFRLHKKTGGLTIFCLVSRIANPSEMPSLPLCIFHTNVQRKVSTDLKNRPEISQRADEVDSEASTSTEQSPSDVKRLKATKPGQEMLGDDPTNQAEANVSLENVPADDDFKFRRRGSQTVQPASVKYPLWKEPSSTNSPPLKNLEEDSDDVLNLHKTGNVSEHPMNSDTKEDTEDRKGLMVIDTSCVVVKVEMIPSPKKEHVHYSVSSINTETNDQMLVSRELNHLNQDISSDQTKLNHLNQDISSDQTSHLNQDVSSNQTKDATHLQINAGQEMDASFSRAQPSPLPGRETLGERAKRILGISLHDVSKEQPDEASVFECHVKELKDEAEPCPSEQTPEDTAEEEEVVQTEVPEEIRHHTNEVRGFTDSQEEFADLSEDNDPDKKTSAETETNAHLETTSEKDQRRDETLPVQESTLPDLCHSALFSPPLLLKTSEEGIDFQLVSHTPDANLTPHPNTSPLPQLSSLPSKTADSLKSTSCTDHLPRTPAEHKGEEDETVEGESPASEKSQQHERHQPDIREQPTEEADEEPQNSLKETFQTSKDEQAQTEGAASVKDCTRIEQQPPQETNKDPTLEAEENSEESALGGHKDENIFQQEFDFCQEENDFCEKGTGKTQKELQISPVVAADLSQSRTTDSQTEIKADNLRHKSFDSICFSALDSPPPPPPDPDIIFAPSLEIDSVCSSPPKCDTAAVETDSLPFHLDSYEESNQSSSFFSVLPLSSTPSPPPEDNAPPASPSVAHKQKVQSPKTLRDVVNRIRKHTAPDSESEEEEVSESWDPESTSETISCPDAVVEVKSKNIVFEESEERVLRECAEMEHMKHDEETQSCSSTNSQSSEDTVIVADDETRLATTMENNEEKSEGETCCSSDDETSSEEAEAAAEHPEMETDSL